MADGTGPGRMTLSGLFFALLMVVLIIVSLYFFIGQPYWFPPLASVHGRDIDSVFSTVLVVTGIAFIIVQGMLGFFIARYGQQGREKAAYWHDNPKVEAFLLILTAVILTVLVFMGQRVWASIYFADRPQNPLTIQVIGQQFNWYFQYPGPDGMFGPMDLKQVTQSNIIGVDRNNPDGKDDIVTPVMHVIQGRPVVVRLRSKDVIHSFFLPNFRLKQDSVPGMSIEVWFTPTRTGDFEIACAELCGLGHYTMRSFLTVDPDQGTFDKWLEEQAQQQ